MTDRTNGYIPTPAYGDTLKPRGNVLIGRPGGNYPVVSVPVASGLADELNRNPAWWDWAQVDPGSADGTPEHWSRFDGHHVLIGIELSTWNIRQVHDWKGRDEITKAGTWRLTFNGEVVYGGDVRDPLAALAEIGRTIPALMGLVIRWDQPDYRGQIEGRKVYYRDQPATLGHWMPEQGCVMVEPAGEPFRPVCYEVDSGSVDGYERSRKAHLLSPDIWWHRDRLTDAELAEACTPEETP